MFRICAARIAYCIGTLGALPYRPTINYKFLGLRPERNGGSGNACLSRPWHRICAGMDAGSAQPQIRAEESARRRLQDRTGVAWSKDDPTAARDDIIDIARSLVRAGR
jgi:hypothetical protein